MKFRFFFILAVITDGKMAINDQNKMAHEESSRKQMTGLQIQPVISLITKNK